MKCSRKFSVSLGRSLRRMLATVGFLAVVTAADASRATAAETRPNVLFIAIDDLNHWVGHLGAIGRRSRRILTGWRPRG